MLARFESRPEPTGSDHLVGETRSPRRVSPNIEEVPSAECPIGPGSTRPSKRSGVRRTRHEFGARGTRALRAPGVLPTTPYLFEGQSMISGLKLQAPAARASEAASGAERLLDLDERIRELK